MNWFNLMKLKLLREKNRCCFPRTKNTNQWMCRRVFNEVGKILGSSSIIVGSIGKVGIILQLMLEKSMQLLQKLKAHLVMIAIPVLINFNKRYGEGI